MQWTVVETLITLISLASLVAGGAWWLSGTLSRFEQTLQANTETIKKSDRAMENITGGLSDHSDRIKMLEFKADSMEKDVQKLKAEIETLKEDRNAKD